MINWYKIAGSFSELNLSAEGMVALEINGKQICVALFKDTLFGFAQKCPHAGGNLEMGYLDAIGNIVCPLHHYKFSIKTGRNISGEGYFLKTYPIESRLGGIFIGLQENN